MAEGAETHQRVLDIRNISGEPFSDIMAALDRLPVGESLLLVNDFEPEPLYGVLEQRGFVYASSRVDDEWQITIRHD